MDNYGIKSCQPFGLATLTKELVACLKTLQSSKCKYKHQYESIIKISKYYLSNSINRVKEFEDSIQVLTPKQELKREIFQIAVESEQMQIKISHIRQEWLQQQHILAELQDCYYRKCQLLTAHNNYYSKQGGALCSLIYLLLGEENALQTFLEEKELFLSFVKIAYGFLNFFINNYIAEPPIEDSSDYKFIMALYSCIAKISWNSHGRILLIEQEEGQRFIWHLVHDVGRIKYKCLYNLKQLAWMILHNISKVDDGTLLLQGCNTFLVRLGNILKEHYEPQLFKYILEILERLSKDIPNRTYLKDFETKIKVSEFSSLNFKEVNLIPRKILINVERATEMFLKEGNTRDVTTVQSKVLSCICTLSEHSVYVAKTGVSDTSLGISTSFICKKMSNKSVQICTTNVVESRHKKKCCKHRKHKKASPKHSLTNSNDALFSLGSTAVPLSSLWTRKKSIIPTPLLSNSKINLFNDKISNTSNQCNAQQICNNIVLTDRISSDSESLPREDFLEKEIDTATLSSNYSQTDDDLIADEDFIEKRLAT